ncbi:MAG: hypothetical protein BAJALOKI2v1_130046 [Promethearchaeota archaeon]|nr:MAG: hypothetical protein BAJALOKI2v1_130046 [Candidatus Lokiarchaeota archaeon]
MYWISSAESEKFVKSVEDAYDKVKREGLNPINHGHSKQLTDENEILTTPTE